MARILIVEDNPACAELARVVCQALGHEAVVAAGPEAALAIAGARRFDLALVACTYDRALGPTLVARLRARHPDLRIVATTALPVAATRAAFDDAPAVEVVGKPFVVGTLRDRLHAALAA